MWEPDFKDFHACWLCVLADWGVWSNFIPLIPKPAWQFQPLRYTKLTIYCILKRKKGGEKIRKFVLSQFYWYLRLQVTQRITNESIYTTVAKKHRVQIQRVERKRQPESSGEQVLSPSAYTVWSKSLKPLLDLWNLLYSKAFRITMHCQMHTLLYVV